MSDVRYSELSWAAITADDENDGEVEIFFRGTDVVAGLRSMALVHDEACAEAIIEDDPVREVLHRFFSKWLTTEADAYDVAVMQALIEHEANQDG